MFFDTTGMSAKDWNGAQRGQIQMFTVGTLTVGTVGQVRMKGNGENDKDRTGWTNRPKTGKEGQF